MPVTTFAPIATGGINQQPITSFVYENIGVNIDITPRTHHDDEVSLALKISLSSISGTGSAGCRPSATARSRTTIRLKDGETNMLAGLIRDEERTVLAGVPGLSDLPLIGRLFAHNRKETQQTDIILTLTPHIVRVLDLSEAICGRSGWARLGALGSESSTSRRPPTRPALGSVPAPAPPPSRPPPPAFPQPLHPATQPPTDPLQIPGGVGPILPPRHRRPPKKPGRRIGSVSPPARRPRPSDRSRSTSDA